MKPTNFITLILLIAATSFQLFTTGAQKINASVISNEQIHQIQPILKQDYHYCFDSTIFDNYFFQFQSFANQQILNFPTLQEIAYNSLNDPLVSQTINLIEILQTSIFNYSIEQKRVLHNELVVKLRKINKMMQENRYDKKFTENPILFKSIEFIESCNLWIFTQPNLMPSIQGFLFSQKILDKDLIEHAPITTLIENSFRSVSTPNRYAGNFSLDSENRDLFLDGFLPSKTFQAFSTQFIWVPRLTVEKVSTKEISINPEFLSYLKVLKQQGKKHLYINLMKRTGSEAALSRALEALAKDPIYSDTLMVLTLDKSLDFYWQKKEFDNLDHAELFKKALMKQLFYLSDEISPFHWPEHINTDLKGNFNEIINSIHSIYFENKTDLSNIERLAFIDICYVKFIERFCEYYRPDYVNVSCKYSMDRGPTLLALIYAYDSITNNHKKSKNLPLNATEKIQFLTMLFAPPLLSHNRAPHEYRIDRIKYTIQLLEEI